MCYEESFSVKSQSSTCRQFIRSLSQRTWKAAVPVELRSDSCHKTRKFLMSNCQHTEFFQVTYTLSYCVYCVGVLPAHMYTLCVSAYIYVNCVVGWSTGSQCVHLPMCALYVHLPKCPFCLCALSYFTNSHLY